MVSSAACAAFALPAKVARRSYILLPVIPASFVVLPHQLKGLAQFLGRLLSMCCVHRCKLIHMPLLGQGRLICPSHFQENRIEFTRILKENNWQLVNLKKDNKVAILVSTDSANALSYVPVSDKVNYITVLQQMYNSLYDLSVEPTP